MKLLINEKSMVLENPVAVEEVINKINSMIGNSHFFSHLIVNGIEIYDDPVSFLNSRYQQINKLEVVVKTGKEHAYDTLATVKQYIENCLPEITKVVDGFYINPSQENWDAFAQLLEGLQWIIQVLELIQKIDTSIDELDQIVDVFERLKLEIVNLQEAVENGDNILIADMINYEIAPMYEKLFNLIEGPIAIEGKLI